MAKWQRKGARPIRVDGDVAYITLTQGKISIIDAADAPLFAGWNWSAHKSERGLYVRRSAKIDGKRKHIYGHHVVAGAVPPGYIPHHEDGNGLNNRRGNLEIIPKSKNIDLANRKQRQNPNRGAPNKTHPGDRRASLHFVKKYGTWSVYVGMGHYKTREEALAIKVWIDEAIAANRDKSGTSANERSFNHVP